MYLCALNKKNFTMKIPQNKIFKLMKTKAGAPPGTLINTFAQTSVHESPRLFSAFFGKPLLIVQIVNIIIVSFTIFKFKKRTLQLKLNQLNIFLHVILVGGIFYYSTIIETKVQATPVYGLGVTLPLISIIALFLANYFIRKDERLVRSADRLR
jgi:hypothetical protein